LGGFSEVHTCDQYDVAVVKGDETFQCLLTLCQAVGVPHGKMWDIIRYLNFVVIFVRISLWSKDTVFCDAFTALSIIVAFWDFAPCISRYDQRVGKHTVPIFRVAYGERVPQLCYRGIDFGQPLHIRVLFMAQNSVVWDAFTSIDAFWVIVWGSSGWNRRFWNKDSEGIYY
jgi:hypothetical protein